MLCRRCVTKAELMCMFMNMQCTPHAGCSSQTALGSILVVPLQEEERETKQTAGKVVCGAEQLGSRDKAMPCYGRVSSRVMWNKEKRSSRTHHAWSHNSLLYGAAHDRSLYVESWLPSCGAAIGPL